MNKLEYAVSTLDYLLKTKRKKHIIGGILMSISLLFIGFAFTVVTLKMTEENDDEQYIE